MFLEADDYIELNPDIFSTNDSLNFNHAYVKYRLQEIDSSLIYLKHVPPTSPLYVSGNNFITQIYMNQGKTDSAKKYLAAKKSVGSPDISSDIFTLQSSGLALLDRDTAAYHKQFYGALFENRELFQQHNTLNETFNELKKVKKKSVLAAGLLSALVPGLGKIYAGNNAQGFSAFLFSGILAAQAYEGYYRGGISDPRFIVYSCLFSLFYVSNIYGSVLSVSVKNNQLNSQINHEITVNTSIPLRYFFGH